MILKHKLELDIDNSQEYEFGEKLGPVGDYDFYHLKKYDELIELCIVGISVVSLSEIPRTTIGLTVRTGEELLQDEFYTTNYNIELLKTYYVVDLQLKDFSRTFIFDDLDTAVSFQLGVLKFKSNNFFEEEVVPLQFEKSRFKKEEAGG